MIAILDDSLTLELGLDETMTGDFGSRSVYGIHGGGFDCGKRVYVSAQVLPKPVEMQTQLKLSSSQFFHILVS